MKPLMFDLFCGLGGATEGFISEGWDCIGIDIERHQYGGNQYPAQLWIQDLLTVHGAQLRDADFLWASPPCQFFSYCAMPWTIAKQLAATVRSDPERLAKETALFNACFRIQREACEAAGRHIPLIVENVRGAQKWIGRSRWNYGSYHLWGDVPALMPIRYGGVKVGGISFSGYGQSGYKAVAFNGTAAKRIAGQQAQTTASARQALGLDDGIKQGGTWWHDEGSISRTTGSKSHRRKEASAMIAKIPLPLARHIASVFRP